MVWGRKGMQRMLQQRAQQKVAAHATSMAKNIDKDDFLRQLKTAWAPHVNRDNSLEQEVLAAKARIEESPFKGAFNVVGVTDEDIRSILEEIRNEPAPIIIEEKDKVGRNSPCPCGSGKKYKRCHGA
jgi:preprotein translocase subunit SecA